MTTKNFNYQTVVKPEWVDYNNHMNDAEYNRVFSDATDAWLTELGLTKQVINDSKYTIFTLENHVLYLKEIKVNERIQCEVTIIDYDAKRIHAFMNMYDEDGNKCATYEVMLMGIATETTKPAPFPQEFKSALDAYAKIATDDIKPRELGHQIEIKRK